MLNCGSSCFSPEGFDAGWFLTMWIPCASPVAYRFNTSYPKNGILTSCQNESITKKDAPNRRSDLASHINGRNEQATVREIAQGDEVFRWSVTAWLRSRRLLRFSMARLETDATTDFTLFEQ